MFYCIGPIEDSGFIYRIASIPSFPYSLALQLLPAEPNRIIGDDARNDKHLVKAAQVEGEAAEV